MLRQAAKMLPLVVTLAANAPTVSASTKVTYYDVSGSTENALREQIDLKRPPANESGERFDAMTNYRLAYNFSVIQEKARCRLTKLEATVDIEVVMPRWAGATPDSKLGAKWLAYYEALENHENGHVKLDDAAVEHFTAAAKKIELPGRCSEAQATLQNAFEEARKDLDRLQADYDRETDHGMKQGAVFP